MVYRSGHTRKSLVFVSLPPNPLPVSDSIPYSFSPSVSMPAPHTLPIVRFSKVIVRPVIWWGKTKENTAPNKAIISEGLKFLDSPNLAQAVKAGFVKWVQAKMERDGHPRVPLLQNSVIELQLEDLKASLDVSISFHAVDDNSNTVTPNICIFSPLLSVR